MERRLLLAIFLSFLVLYIYQALVVKPVPKPPNGAATTAPSLPEADRPSTSSSPAAPRPDENAASPAAPSAPPLVADANERDIHVETRDVIAVFTNRGARLKSWRLKHYFDEQHQPQELIEQHVTTQPQPFTLRTANDAVTATVNDALYTVAGAPAATAAETSPVDL